MKTLEVNAHKENSVRHLSYFYTLNISNSKSSTAFSSWWYRCCSCETSASCWWNISTYTVLFKYYGTSWRYQFCKHGSSPPVPFFVLRVSSALTWFSYFGEYSYNYLLLLMCSYKVLLCPRFRTKICAARLRFLQIL